MTIFAYAENMKDMINTTPLGMVLGIFLGIVGIYTMFGVPIADKIRSLLKI